MEWFDFLENSNSQKPAFDLCSVTPHDNREVKAQADQWTPEEKQLFQNAFYEFINLGSQIFFEHVSIKLPNKSIEEIKNHYLTLFNNHDMENPVSKNKVVIVAVDDHDHQHYQLSLNQDDSSNMETTFNDAQPPQVESTLPRRRRWIPWTETEHKLFLMGLNKFGKGKWKNIAEEYVVSKTPAQVASHAHNFFSRQNSTTPVERRRPSINDIQTINFNPETPITMPMGHQINNGILAYNNNHQVGTSTVAFRYPYTFGGASFGNNSNKDFERFNRGEVSKTPTQVASHAHNFFSRQNSTTPVKRRRPSINDIQTITFNPETAITMPMGHQINNDRLAYNNNHQVGTSTVPFRCPYSFGGAPFGNNSNEDFEKFNRDEVSDNNSFAMELNNNNLRGPMSLIHFF